MNRTLSIILFSTLVSLACTSACVAEKGKAPLALGSTLGQVFTAWGEPQEKIERGLKQELVWYYPAGAFVTFKQGKVIAYRIAGQQVVDAALEARTMQAQQTIAAAPTSSLNGNTRDLVRDIARELPSSPDAPYSESPNDSGAAGVGGRGVVSPPVPPPSSGALVPGDVESDIEDGVQE